MQRHLRATQRRRRRRVWPALEAASSFRLRWLSGEARSAARARGRKRWWASLRLGLCRRPRRMSWKTPGPSATALRGAAQQRGPCAHARVIDQANPTHRHTQRSGRRQRKHILAIPSTTWPKAHAPMLVGRNVVCRRVQIAVVQLRHEACVRSSAVRSRRYADCLRREADCPRQKSSWYVWPTLDFRANRL